MFKVEKIQGGYGKKHVVNNVSFELEQGEFCALLGTNGCGKTTLLKTLCGLISATSGECTISEKPVWSINEKDRARLISYIPQRGSNIFGKTVLDVVLMGFNSQLGIFENYSRKQIDIALESLLKVGFYQNENTLYEELSEGQKQLVILARTMVQSTPVVLMDEPDSALDFTNKNRILNTITNLIHAEQKAGLIALQDPNIALHFCDRLLLMKDGCIIQEIKKDEFSDLVFLQTELENIYEGIKILDNDGVPVVVRDISGDIK